MQGEMNYWNNKHYITVCFDKLEPYKFHLTKLRDILYALNLAFKIIKKKKKQWINVVCMCMYFLFDVPLVPPVKTHQFYNMMQPLFSSTPAIKVED